MRRKSNCLATFRLLLVCLSLVLLAGCQPGFQTSTVWPMADVARDGVNTARLSVFLNLKEAEGPGMGLEISDLEVLRADAWLSIQAGLQELDSEKIGDGQVFLGGRAVPPGRYQQLRFTVDKGTFRRAGGEYAVLPGVPFIVELEMPSALLMEESDSRSLFITWDVESSLERGEEPRPVMNIAPLVRPMLVDLLYAACPDIDTVFVIRTDRSWVVDSFGLKGQPTYLAMDPDPSRRRLYILAPGEAAIKAVDISSQRIIDSIHIPMTDTPTFLTISPDTRWAYVLDERASYLNQIELATGRSAARVRVPYRPQYAAYLADQNVLAVSAGLSQVVTLHNPTNLAEVGTIRTGSSPEGLLAAAGQLYVAERGDHTVAIFNLAANRNQGRLDVGFGPRRLLFDGDQIYVSNYDSGSLSVLIPEQMGVVREIHGLGRPLEMAFDETYRRIYVGDEQAGALAVIDSTSNQLLGYIHLGARPLGLAVLP